MPKPTFESRTAAGVLTLVVLTTALGACSSDGDDAPSTTVTTSPSTATSTPTTPAPAGTTTPTSAGTTAPGTPAPSATAPPAPSMEPTQKSINPTGGNLFTPDVKAPGPPTPAPGNLPGNN